MWKTREENIWERGLGKRSSAFHLLNDGAECELKAGRYEVTRLLLLPVVRAWRSRRRKPPEKSPKRGKCGPTPNNRHPLPRDITHQSIVIDVKRQTYSLPLARCLHCSKASNLDSIEVGTILLRCIRDEGGVSALPKPCYPRHGCPTIHELLGRALLGYLTASPSSFPHIQLRKMFFL